MHEGVHATVERRDDVGGEGANRGEIGEVQRGTGRGPAGGRETHGVGVRPRGEDADAGPEGSRKGSASRSGWSGRHPTMTVAPAPARRRAVSRPMPSHPPVTTTFVPASPPGGSKRIGGRVDHSKSAARRPKRE